MKRLDFPQSLWSKKQLILIRLRTPVVVWLHWVPKEQEREDYLEVECHIYRIVFGQCKECLISFHLHEVKWELTYCWLLKRLTVKFVFFKEGCLWRRLQMCLTVSGNVIASSCGCDKQLTSKMREGRKIRWSRNLQHSQEWHHTVWKDPRCIANSM